MSTDTFWDKKIAEYLMLCIEQDHKNKFCHEFFELLHTLMSYQEIEAINKLIYLELNKIAKANSIPEKAKKLKPHNNKIYLTNSGRRSYKSVTAVVYNFQKVDETAELLRQNFYSMHNWGMEISTLVVSIPSLQLALSKKLIKILNLKQKAKGLSVLQSNLQNVSNIFKLNKTEEDLVVLFYLYENHNQVRNFFDEINLDFRDFNKSARAFFRFFNYVPSQIRPFLNKDSPLIRAGILKRRDETLEITENISSYLAGVGVDNILSSYFTLDKTSTILDKKDFQVTHEMIDSCLDLVQSNKGVNILLHGAPGAGKTEFSKYLGKALGKEVYFIKQNDESGDEDLSFRKSGIVAAQNVLDPKNSVIVVDECDEIVNVGSAFWNCERDSGGDKKAWINYLLENSKHNVIWISNRVNGVDDSTKRRFSYSLEFSDFTTKQRIKVWETMIQNEKIDFISKDQVEIFAHKFKVNAGGISLALKDVLAMPHMTSNAEKVQKINSLLVQHQEFVFGKKTDLALINPQYKLDVLNCDTDMYVIMTNVQKFLKYTSDKNNTDIPNMNFLLQGPPGTGKTEFVKFLSQSVDQELLVKRLSDIRSKWYGENLQNIAAIFKQASAEGKILFLDEADSFFMNRETSSEHYVAETNELLTQMENFKGILICATNFSTSMDQASMRRFNYKIKFDYLNDAGKLSMFKFQFGKFLNGELSKEVEERVKAMKFLTPGDFKVVYQKNAFNEEVTIESLVNQLENEVSYKKVNTKLIGFRL